MNQNNINNVQQKRQHVLKKGTSNVQTMNQEMYKQ